VWSVDRNVLAFALTAAWGSWVVFGAADAAVEVAEGRRPPDAGFSFVPVIPLFPLLFWGAAVWIDSVAPPLGTYTVTALHLAMFVGYVWGTFRAVARLRVAKGQ
jgi:hypothetical protein